MQSLNKKEQKLFELQITQIRHPKVLWTDGQGGSITLPAFAKATQVKSKQIYLGNPLPYQTCDSKPTLGLHTRLEI